MVTPVPSPYSTINRTLAYWAARETADICACPTKFSITTSAELTAALSRFCRMIGPVSFMICLHTGRSSRVIRILLIIPVVFPPSLALRA